MIPVRDYLIQLNSEGKRFIAGLRVSDRKDRCAKVLDQLQSEVEADETGRGLDIYMHDRRHLCYIIDDVIMFPNQEMMDLFTRTLFATE